MPSRGIVAALLKRRQNEAQLDHPTQYIHTTGIQEQRNGAINYCIRKELKVFLFLNHKLVSLLYYYHIECYIKIRLKVPS